MVVTIISHRDIMYGIQFAFNMVIVGMWLCVYQKFQCVLQKLVNEVFQTMWFTPIKDTHTGKLLSKVVNITDVVSM